MKKRCCNAESRGCDCDQSAAAKADLDAALEIDPDDIEAYRARAEARLQLRDYAGALEDCAKVLRAFRRDPTAYYVRGMALAQAAIIRRRFAV